MAQLRSVKGRTSLPLPMGSLIAVAGLVFGGLAPAHADRGQLTDAGHTVPTDAAHVYLKQPNPMYYLP